MLQSRRTCSGFCIDRPESKILNYRVLAGGRCFLLGIRKVGGKCLLPLTAESAFSARVDSFAMLTGRLMVVVFKEGENYCYNCDEFCSAAS